MDFFTRLAYAVIAHRRAVVVTWLVVVAALAPLALALPDRLGPGGFDVTSSQSYRAQQAIGSDFDGATSDPTIVLLRGDPAAVTAAVPLVTKALRATEGVTGVTPGAGLADASRVPAGRAYLTVALSGGQDGQVRGAQRVIDAAEAAAPAGVEVVVGGRS